MITKKSLLMDELYGIELSNQVYNNLEGLDSELNREVQEIAYEHYWARPGLPIRDKSLVTVVSLISLGKEKQIRPHIIGFLNTGGTNEELLNVLCFLSKSLDSSLVRNGIKIAIDVFTEQDDMPPAIYEFQKIYENDIKNIKISENIDTYLAGIASCAAIGNNENTKLSIQRYLVYSGQKINDVKNVLIHLIVYCGFPVAINGFNALKDVLTDHHHQL